jgi:hypothetical protein
MVEDFHTRGRRDSWRCRGTGGGCKESGVEAVDSGVTGLKSMVEDFHKGEARQLAM